MRDHVCFSLNGRERTVHGRDVFLTVSDYLRGPCQAAGTKVVCAEGDCGACTVLINRGNGFVPIDSCIQFVHQIDGAQVMTVEGLSATNELHPVQQALIDHHGSQCGYCTPGFVMALAGWKEAGCPVDAASPRISLTGNLCRCTGYTAIFAAADQIRRMPASPLAERYPRQSFATDALRVEADGRTVFMPTTLADAIAFKQRHPEAQIVAGATELGVWRNKRGFEPAHLLNLSRLAELDGVTLTDSAISIGANATWTQIEPIAKQALPEFHKIIERFGSPQIRNAGTLAGNVANGSPIADSLALLFVLDATIEIAGPTGQRRRSINGFYTGYKKKDLAPDELISRIVIPLPAPGDRMRLIKVSRRWDMDIASFGAAILIREEAGVINHAAVAFTGVASTVVRLPTVEAALVGKPMSEETFRKAGKAARAAIRPIDDVRGSAEFRLQLAENALLKFYWTEYERSPGVIGGHEIKATAEVRN